MILEDIFGNTVRIRILEEMLAKWGIFLSVEEIARMADVSKKSVYIHMEKLEEIGILIIDNKDSKKYKLNGNDERALALGLIETKEFRRKIKESY